MGSGKVGKHSTHSLPFSLVSAQVLVGANPPEFSLERSACLLPSCLDPRGFCWELSLITDGGFNWLGVKPDGPSIP